MKRHPEIERDIKKAFPGWKGKFTYTKEEWWLDNDPDSRESYYELYPNLSEQDADEQIVIDRMAIINRHLPYFRLADYEQHGKLITLDERS